MGGICQCQRHRIKAPMMCMIPEDSKALYGLRGSREESFVGSLMTTLPTAVSVVLRENRASGTFSGSKEDSFQEVPGYSS